MTTARIAMLVAVAVGALVAGCGGGSQTPSGHVLHGSITVPAYRPAPACPSPSPVASGSPSPRASACPSPSPTPTPTGVPTCRAAKGYADIHKGTRVFVRDADGNTLASGELTGGTPVSKQAGRCRFAFAVDGLPESPVYAVKVGLRDPVRYGFSVLVTADWRVSLAVG